MIDSTLRLIDQFTPVLKTAQTAVKSSETAMKAATTQTRVLSGATKSYSASAMEMEKINQRTAKSIDGIGKSMSSVGKIAFVATLTGAAAEGFKLEQSLDKITARISMLGNVSPAELQKIKKGIMDVSNATGVAIETVADATKTAVESGIKAADALGYVQNAIKLSKVAGDDLGTTMQQLTTFTKSYYLTVEDAARLSDQMVVTAGLAQVPLRETNAALAPIAKSAADAGISVQQMSAAFALMGAHKIPAEEAGAALRTMFDSFSKASPKAIKAAQEFGIELNRAHIQAVGFPAFLQEVMEKTGGNEQAIAKIIPDLNAFKMALMLTSTDGLSEYNDYLNKISNSQGATADALGKIKTPSAETVKAMNELRNAGIELADGMAPLFTRGADMIRLVIGAFNSLSDSQKEIVFNALQFIIIFGILSITGGKVISMFSNIFGATMKFAAILSKAGGMIPFIIKNLTSLASTFKLVGSAAKLLFANPIGLVIMGVIVLVYLFCTHLDQAKAIIAAAWGGIVNTFEWAVNAIAPHISGIIEMFQGIIDFVTGAFTGNWSLAWQGVCEIFEGYFDQIKGICETVLSGIKAAINAVIGGINGVSVDIPDWVPGVGGKHYQPNIPYLAQGTEFWQGGLAMIHDAGPEIVDLPTGTRVIPHDKSMQEEYERGRAESGSTTNITIDRLADTVVVREDADIDKLAKQFVQRLESYARNRAEGAV
jgi:TP901 family phage tail tape measure protein